MLKNIFIGKYKRKTKKKRKDEKEMCLQTTRMKIETFKDENSNDEKEMYRTTLNQN